MKLLEILHEIQSICCQPHYMGLLKKNWEKKENKIVMLFPYCMGKHPVLGTEIPESKVRDWGGYSR